MDDKQDLRRCMRDLVAISTLPAIWGNADAQSIVRGLADALLRLLSLDFAYVRLHGPGGAIVDEVARTRHGTEPAASAHEIGLALAPWLQLDSPSDPPTSIANPVGPGNVRLTLFPLGHAHDHGLLAVGSARPDFPTDHERILLSVAANQAAGSLQHREAQEQLRRSEQELGDFFENASVGMHWADMDGTILRANKAELELLGYRREEYVGHNIARFHADPDILDDIMRRLRSGEELHEYPARLRGKDGSLKDVLIDSSALFRDGKFVHTRCFTRDVTERKKAERMAREQEERSRTILESITDAFCALDRNWNFVYVNQQAATLIGRSAEDLVGRNHWEEFPDTIGTQVERQFRRAVDEDTTVAFEHFYVPHQRWYEVHAYPSSDGLSIYFRDVTERRSAEESIRENESRMRLLADTMPQLAWMARPDGYVIWYNRRWYEYTGTTPEQMEGWGWQSVHDPDVLPTVLDRWKASIANTEPFDMVFPIKGADNQFRSFLTRVNPLRDAKGRVLYWFGTNTDVSEQKQAEEALRQSEQRMRLATQATGVGIWEWNVLTGAIKWDAQMFRIYGIDPARGGIVSYETWSGAVLPEDLPHQEQILADTIRRLGQSNREFRIRRANDGECRHIQAVETVRTNPQGHAEWVVGTNLDVTERRHRDEMLAVQKRALELLVRGAPLPDMLDALCEGMERQGEQKLVATVLLADPDGRRLRTVAGCRAPPDVVPPMDGLELRPRAGAGGTPGGPGEAVLLKDMATDLSCPDHREGAGRDGLRACWSMPIFSSQNTVLGALAVYYPDSRQPTAAEVRMAEILTRTASVVIERRRDEEALRDADRRKDEFLAMLSHELRNPLAPIRSAVHVLKLDERDGENPIRRQAREVIERQAANLAKLVNDLLDVSRVVVGRIRLDLKPVELNEVIAQAIVAIKPLFEQHNHELVFHPCADDVWCSADAARLEQVIVNLLNNAAKYTPDGGRIELRCEGTPAAEFVQVRVRDNGIGIAPELLAGGRLFELFTQAERSLDRAAGGLGIGLSLVRRIVELHRGTVEVYSPPRGADRGSEFIVMLPAVAAPPERAKVEPEGSAPGTDRRRVLVVDDNNDQAAMLARILAKQGYRVQTADNGVDALTAAAQFRPDVVLLDIGLPGLDGYEVARRLRSDPELGQSQRQIRLIALTGYGGEADLARARDAGFDAHLVKPCDFTELETLVAAGRSNGNPPAP